MPRSAILAGLLAATLSASGCESMFGKPETLPCPTVGVPRDLSEIVVFAGSGRDLIDVDHAGRIRDVDSTCRFEFDDDAHTRGTLHVTVTPLFEAERGNADNDRAGVLPYFVAVATAARAPRQKRDFSVTARFPGNVSRMRFADTPVHLEVPLGEGERGHSYRIYVGFQLTPEQLAFNRKRFQRR